MELFRKLNEEEKKDFRQWARKNYVANTEIKSIWHPIVKKECQIINHTIKHNKDE